MPFPTKRKPSRAMSKISSPALLLFLQLLIFLIQRKAKTEEKENEKELINKTCRSLIFWYVHALTLQKQKITLTDPKLTKHPFSMLK